MKKQVLTVIHPYSTQVEPVIAADRNCPSDSMFIIPGEFGDPNSKFLELSRIGYDFQKDTAEWIRRYDNVLKGLNYWRAKALELAR